MYVCYIPAPLLPPPKKQMKQILTLFIMSYVVSIGVNVNNKRAINLVPLPWTYAAVNLLMGATVSFVTWGVKAAFWPRISAQVRILQWTTIRTRI